jgi:F420-non-reducing hydrogenase iron-sulfur subunit
MHRLLEFTGLEPDRLFVEWVSASEGKKFADVTTAFTDRIRSIGPSPLKRQPAAAPVVASQEVTQ